MRQTVVKNVVSEPRDIFRTDLDTSQTKIGLSEFSLRNTHDAVMEPP